MTDAPTLLPAAAATAALSFAGVWAFLVVARKRRFVAEPTERSSHSVPTPTGGGVGIAAAILCGLLLSPVVPGAPDLRLFAPGFALAAVTGFLDDRKPLAAAPKLGLLVVAAAAGLAAARFHRPEVPPFGPVPFDSGGLPLAALGVLLTVLWTSGFSNAFNFMDGINGLAGGTAVVSGGAFAAAGAIAGAPDVTALGAMIAGGAAGFLPWNVPVPRIFMGDSGSLPLGLLIAQTAVLADARGALPFAASLVLLAPYVCDVVLTLARRRREGKPLSQGHKEHVYQRLQRALGSHGLATSCYVAAELGCATLALSWGSLGPGLRVLSLILVPAALLACAPWVFRAERSRAASIPPQGASRP